MVSTASSSSEDAIFTRPDSVKSKWKPKDPGYFKKYYHEKELNKPCACDQCGAVLTKQKIPRHQRTKKCFRGRQAYKEIFDNYVKEYTLWTDSEYEELQRNKEKPPDTEPPPDNKPTRYEYFMRAMLEYNEDLPLFERPLYEAPPTKTIVIRQRLKKPRQPIDNQGA